MKNDKKLKFKLNKGSIFLLSKIILQITHFPQANINSNLIIISNQIIESYKQLNKHFTMYTFYQPTNYVDEDQFMASFQNQEETYDYGNCQNVLIESIPQTVSDYNSNTNLTNSLNRYNNFNSYNNCYIFTNNTQEIYETYEMKESTVPVNSYDPNNVREIDELLNKFKNGSISSESTNSLKKTTLEKQKQKAKRSCLNAFLIKRGIAKIV